MGAPGVRPLQYYYDSINFMKKLFLSNKKSPNNAAERSFGYQRSSHRQVKLSAGTFLSLIAAIIMVLSACSKEGKPLKIDNPNSSTNDEILPAFNEKSVESSPNVNGMRFTMTIDDFTDSYNEFKREKGEQDLISKDKWKQKDGVARDNNGVEIKYFYYDDDEVNFTATVEADSGKLLNIGCGTTMSTFMSQDENGNNSDRILYKAAVMAKTVCRFPTGSEGVMQDIFYRITTENIDSMWYQGFIFSLSTQEDKSDPKSNVMLFRVFPISETLKEEWNPQEYF